MKQDGLIFPILLIASLLGSVLLAALLDSRGALAKAAEESFYLPDARYLKPILLGFDGVAADLLWIRTVQYVGSHLETDKKFPQLAKALDLADLSGPALSRAIPVGGALPTLFCATT